MLSLGIDIGTSTVKLVLLKNQEIEKQWMAVHHGNPFVCLKKGLSTLELAMDTPFSQSYKWNYHRFPAPLNCHTSS